MTTLRELLIEIGVDADDAGIKKIEKGLSDVIGVAKAVGVAIAAAGAAVFGLAKSAANYADKIEDTAMAVGVTNHSLQTLAHAAKLSGASFEELEVGLRSFSRNMRDAADKGGIAADAFARLRVNTQDANGNMRDSDAVLADVADRFASMSNGAEKTALAMDIFGRSGTRLIPMLNAGAGGIAEMRAEAERLGIVLDDNAIRAGSDFNDSLDRLSAVFIGLKNSIGAAVIPALMELVDSLREIVVANMDIIRTNLTKFMNGLIRVIKATTKFVGFLSSGFSRISSVVGGMVPLLKTLGFLLLAAGAGKLVMGLAAVAKGFMMVSKSILLTKAAALLIPILIGAAVLLAALAIDDFIAFVQGRPSVLGFLIKNRDEILAKIKETLNSIVIWIDSMFQKMFNLLELGIAEVFKFFGVMDSEAYDAAKNIVDAFRWLYDQIKSLMSFLGSTIADNFENFVKPIAQTLVAMILEPMNAIKQLPQLFEQVANMIFSTLASVIDFFIGGILRVFGVPEEKIKWLMDFMRWGLSNLAESIGVAVDTVLGVIDSVVGGLVDGVLGGLSAVAKFTAGIFGGRNDTDVQTQAQQSLVGAMQQSTTNNQAVNSTTQVSPTINVTVNSAGEANGEDIARKIRDEITAVARSVNSNNQPQFAN